MIDVVCVLWGDKFSLDYAYNLQAMVRRNTTLEHRFLCFSDRQIPSIETKLLKKGYTGWWNKLQLFDKSHELNQHVVFFDLDTLVVNNIDWLLGYTGAFMGIEDVGASATNISVQRRKINQMQSGVLAFDSTKNYQVWDNFSKDKNATRKFRGDGEYLNGTIKNRDLLQHKYPEQLKSYKWHLYPNRPRPENSIVCFHGKPSIQQSVTTDVKVGRQYCKKSTWVAEYWNSK